MFKDQLAMFLLENWQKEHYGSILGNKTLIVSRGGRCVRIRHDEASAEMLIESPGHFQGNHCEADALIAFYASTAVGNILVRASDTDVLVILIGMLGREQRNSGPIADLQRIIMDCGNGNSRRYIDVSTVVNALESKQAGLAAALPVMNALTGCDYASAFYRKGKVKSLRILENDTKGAFVQFFCNMSVMEPTTLDVKIAEDFVCQFYGLPGEINSVDEARHVTLCQMTEKIDPVRNSSKIAKCHNH